MKNRRPANARQSDPTAADSVLLSGFVALCFFLSGAAGLVYQVIWVRPYGQGHWQRPICRGRRAVGFHGRLGPGKLAGGAGHRPAAFPGGAAGALRQTRTGHRHAGTGGALCHGRRQAGLSGDLRPPAGPFLAPPGGGLGRVRPDAGSARGPDGRHPAGPLPLLRPTPGPPGAPHRLALWAEHGRGGPRCGAVRPGLHPFPGGLADPGALRRAEFPHRGRLPMGRPAAGRPKRRAKKARSQHNPTPIPAAAGSTGPQTA